MYDLSKEEHDALSYSLGHHIPGNVTCKESNTEFELFLSKICYKLNIDRIKRKLRSVCKKYQCKKAI